ncbi:MAG: hypothetical protein Q7T20_04530 [Saprospiraceae bacterium]|nr:hypothetical protein [Saprospiraceae bacterium]
MENPNYKIDEIFRQRLHYAEVPPPPFVWPAVEQALRKRRRRLVLWLFTFGVVAACAVLWQFNQWNQSNTDSMVAPRADIQTNEPVITAQEQEETVQNTATPTFERTSTVPTTGSGSEVFAKTSSRGKVTTNASHSVGVKTEPTPAPAFIDLTPGNIQASLIETPVLAISTPQMVVSMARPKEAASLKAFKSYSRKKKAQPKFCYDFSQHPSAWLIDVYAGPSLAQGSLTSNVDDEPYLHQRLATERRSIAMNAGLRASFLFNRNYLIRTGLHFDHITEVFEYIDPAYTKYRLDVTVLPNGQTHIDTLGVEYGENYLKTYNRYAMLDVPLIVGVEMRRGRSGFSINAGISANILFQKQGVIIDPNTHEPARFGPIPEKPEHIGPKATLSEDAFRANVGLSAEASVQWYWHLYPHFRLFVEPSFRQVLRPVSLGSHPVEQRYRILGLRIGATKIF